MRVYVEPMGLHSRAMKRVAAALERYAPRDVTIVTGRRHADVVVLHVIGSDAIPFVSKLRADGKQYCIIQYCLRTAGGSDSEWIDVWRGARATWSYYDLPRIVNDNGFTFLHAPLGVDDVFMSPVLSPPRRPGVVTTGYVSGPGAEAIEQTWIAARRLGLPVVHVGPSVVVGAAEKPAGVSSILGLSDREMNRLYRSVSFVSAMRHVEGFELPAAEGLVCGARPIMFNQPATYRWYDDMVKYVPDVNGDALVDAIQAALSSASPVTEVERTRAMIRFSWRPIVDEFWKRVLGEVV